MAMQDQVNAAPAPLQIEGRTRDLAMFNLAIDSKLRGCDVVAIRVEDVAAGGYTADRATVRQKENRTACHAFTATHEADLIYRRTGNLRLSSCGWDMQRSKAPSDISASK
jgi:hypothetical protein